MSIKATTYITVETAARWLKIPKKKIGLDGGVRAFKAIADLTYTTSIVGTPGNSVLIAYTPGATAGAEVVTVTGLTITVQIQDTVSTAQQIALAVLASAPAMALLQTVAITGTSSNTQSMQGPTALTGGTYDKEYVADWYTDLEEMCDGACSMVESIIDGPVLTRSFTEQLDGSNSNVVVPSQWPIRSITSLKVDYNRNFDSVTEIPLEQYFIRGGADTRQILSGNAEIKIGTDIVLVDDNEKFILGSIFAGSIIGSIKITYTAGWGLSLADMPAQIPLVTKQLIEFYWTQRDNRDIGVKSRGVMGQSYVKLKDTIPEQIIDALQPFMNVSLGGHPTPQRNVFRV